jgi:hypothetical protein
MSTHSCNEGSNIHSTGVHQGKRRGRREGTIFQRRDGRWSGSLDLGWDQGRRRRKCFYGTTRAEVREKLTRALGEIQRGGSVDLDERVTVGQYLDRWLGTVSVRRKTARSYHQFVTLHLTPGLGRIRLTKLTPGRRCFSRESRAPDWPPSLPLASPWG